MTDDQLHEEFDVEEAPVHTEEAPQYGVGPFSIREVALVGVWVVAFVVSFFSINGGRFDSVWTSGLLWVLSIGVPTVAVFLLVLRRLSPEGIRRVGSLGIDQFASVAFSVAAMVWLQLVWETVAFASATGQWVRTWVIWVELVLMIVGVLLTVFAPLIPVFEEDFRGRPESPAHRNARAIRRIAQRPPRAPREAAPAREDVDAYASAPQASFSPEQQSYTGQQPSYTGQQPYAEQQPFSDSSAAASPAPAVSAADDTATTVWEPAQARDTFEPIEEPTSTAAPVEEPAVRHQAFWALVPEDRDVVDEIGIPVFRIGPNAWALVIEDRGEAFVVRHEDGRVGYLHDVSGVTRG